MPDIVVATGKLMAYRSISSAWTSPLFTARISPADHVKMDLGRLVPGKADEAGLALLFGKGQRFEHATLGVGKSRIVVEDHAVDLPQVEVIRLQSAKRFLKHSHGKSRAAAMRTNLGHEKDVAAPALECPAKPILGPAVPILPTVVAKGYAGIYCFMHNANRLLNGFEFSEVVASKP